MSDPRQGYDNLHRFDRVDADAAALGMLAFLDRVEAKTDNTARRRRCYALLGLADGHTVAEIGCGTGTAAREIAAEIVVELKT